jgi:hypothetical protein
MLRAVLSDHDRNRAGNLFWLFIRFELIYKLVSWIQIIFQVRPCRSSCDYSASSYIIDLCSTRRQVMLDLCQSDHNEWDLLRLHFFYYQITLYEMIHIHWSYHRRCVVSIVTAQIILHEMLHITDRIIDAVLYRLWLLKSYFTKCFTLLIVSSTLCCIDCGCSNHTSRNASHSLIISSTLCRIDCDSSNHTSRNASHSLIIISSTLCCIDCDYVME